LNIPEAAVVLEMNAKGTMQKRCPLHLLQAKDKTGALQVVIEVPRHSTSKFKYLPESGTFVLHRSLPAGLFFPYDYGFIPSTLGEDGDALDALVFIDTNTFPGCVVKTRLLGVITATQKGDAERVANDILLAVHLDAVSWKDARNLRDIPRELLDEIEFFFTSYRNFQGKEFQVRQRRDAAFAQQLVERAIKRFQRSQSQE